MGSILEDVDVVDYGGTSRGAVSSGASNASISSFVHDALQVAGVSQQRRRNFTRMIDAATRLMQRGTEGAGAENNNLDSEEEDDDAIFVSLAEVKTTMRGFGISAGTIHSLCHTLRRFALS